jgi:hypothetical protein
MIVLSAGCASLASLMRDAERCAGPETKRAPVENDRRPRLVSINDGDQRAV